MITFNYTPKYEICQPPVPINGLSKVFLNKIKREAIVNFPYNYYLTVYVF